MKSEQKGSITVYLSLLLLLFTALISTAIRSAKISAGRAMAAASAEAAVFSLFSCYDREIFADWHLLFLNGGEDPGVYLRFLKEEAAQAAVPDPLFGRDPLALAVTGCSIDGLRTAACGGGTAAAAQAVLYMKQTLGITAVSTLWNAAAAPLAGAESDGAARLADDPAKQLAEIQKSPAAETAEKPDVPAVPDNENPIKVAEALQKKGLLSLLLPDGATVSGKKVSPASLPSGRTLSDGAGIIDAPSLSGTGDSLLLGEYVLRHTGNYLTPANGALAYGTEYILAGKDSDEKNLKSVLKRLLCLRTGANALTIAGDAALSGEAYAAADTLAAALAVPEAAPVLRVLFVTAWAFTESVLDIRALLSGMHVPAVKSAETWQLRAADIPRMLTEPDALLRDCPGGLAYTSWLRVLLALSGTKKVPLRLLDLIEGQVRSRGHEGFCIDTCVDALSCTISFYSENTVPFSVRQSGSYLDDPP